MKAKINPRISNTKIPKSTFIDHKTLLAPMHAEAVVQDPAFLGYPKSVVTVCNCASSSPSNLFSTLDQLGVNGIAFQQCVFGTIITLGYSIDVDLIPDSPTSTLISVVNAITNARRTKV